MTGSRIIKIEDSERKDQFHFFQNYHNPYFGLTANLDVTQLLKHTRQNKYSFFATSLFASQQSVNSIPEFKYRIVGDELHEFDHVKASSTVLKENNVFTFCYFDHHTSFKDFHAHVLERTAECKNPETVLIDRDEDLAQIYYSIIPWVHFTGLTHSQKKETGECIPKIVFGKYAEIDGKMQMPVSVEAHHALLDGYHLGLYFKRFQDSINDPRALLEG